VLQGFSAASLQLQAAVTQLPAKSPHKPRFSQLARLVQRVLDEGRRAIEGLRSCPDNPRSLGEALACVPTELGFHSAANFHVVVIGRPRDLKPELDDEVYHIGREAIINAYRHSQAKTIEAQVEYRSAELRIMVRDNGRGIDEQNLAKSPNGHWGLKGMHERADRIGARLRVLSRAAVGTEIELCLVGGDAYADTSFAY